MTLESSITQLNDSVQELIKVISALDTVAPKSKAVKAVKPAAVKVEPTTPVRMASEIAAACVAANVPEVNEVISEMKAITDRKVLFSLLEQFDSKTASGIPADKRAAFIEAIHMELQKGAA
jgi:hypothetical protein